MAKQTFTTRLDPEIRALAERIAETERRSLTAVLENAVLEYAKQHNFQMGETKNG